MLAPHYRKIGQILGRIYRPNKFRSVPDSRLVWADCLSKLSCSVWGVYWYIPTIIEWIKVSFLIVSIKPIWAGSVTNHILPSYVEQKHGCQK